MGTDRSLWGPDQNDANPDAEQGDPLPKRPLPGIKKTHPEEDHPSTRDPHEGEPVSHRPEEMPPPTSDNG